MTKKRVAKKAISADDFIRLMDEQDAGLNAEVKVKKPRQPKAKKTKTEKTDAIAENLRTDSKITNSDETTLSDEKLIFSNDPRTDSPPLRYQSVLVEWLYSQAFERIDKMGPIKKEILTLTTNLIFRK